VSVPRTCWTRSAYPEWGRDVRGPVSDAVLVDKAYCSRGNCRPPTFDAEPDEGRNVIELSFNVLQQWRGMATRYDKLALTYRGGVVLGAPVRRTLA
jgi:transposase